MNEWLAQFLPSWFMQAFAFTPELSQWRQLGLAFLLGSFAVATWSDLKRLSAQREFLEIWLVFLAAVAIYDAVEVGRGVTAMQVPLIKWGFILVLSVASWEKVGWLFRLAPADVAALAATASLLSPVLIVLFYAGARVLSYLLQPLLSRGRNVYPFMPVVSLAAVLVLALALMA